MSSIATPTQSTVETFSYDGLGNISNTTALGHYLYTHPSGLPHAVSSAGSNAYQYDGNGNLETRSGPQVPGGTQSFAYTAFNLPKSIITGGTGRTTTLEYDASGQRVVKQDPDGETRYIPGLYERRTLTAAPGAVEHVYRIFAGGREVAQVQHLEQGGAPTSKTIYLHDDALGSTNVITDSTGVALHTQRYHPYGKSESPGAAATGVNTGFTGHDDEDDLGLVNMKGRLYDPTTGRFTTPDPFVQAAEWSQGFNRYSYAWNNPLKWVDPSGFDDEGSDDEGGNDDGGGSTYDGYSCSGSGQCGEMVINEQPYQGPDRNAGFMEDQASYTPPNSAGADTSRGTAGTGDFAPSAETTMASFEASVFNGIVVSDASGATFVPKGTSYFSVDVGEGRMPGRTGEVGQARSEAGAMFAYVAINGTALGPAIMLLNHSGTVGQRMLAGAAVFATVLGPLASGLSGAAAGESGMVSLFRAVEPGELASIESRTAFTNPLGIESKYFSTTVEGAAREAKMLSGLSTSPGPFTIVETSIPNSALQSLPAGNILSVDQGISRVVLGSEHLSSLSTPQVWSYVPVP